MPDQLLFLMGTLLENGKLLTLCNKDLLFGDNIPSIGLFY